jgi:hypothetical protein
MNSHIAAVAAMANAMLIRFNHVSITIVIFSRHFKSWPLRTRFSDS